jgi:hypothetical protein
MFFRVTSSSFLIPDVMGVVSFHQHMLPHVRGIRSLREISSRDTSKHTSIRD